ncbi:uncharacterized protein LOC129725842 isoform X2 [Wyeomyia smithii]|uniref:uncharacterized protein LOC129725842 isoform X2 n=1 Tax=Wyeomyia smithii TaxID=174621 RepID=UPI0024681DAC|nr:uncharacterized protein LOC129725842 isoform X2 [Wyeomyia smithii]
MRYKDILSDDVTDSDNESNVENDVENIEMYGATGATEASTTTVDLQPGQETVIEEKSECTIQNEEVDEDTNVAKTGTEATLDQQLCIDTSKSADTNKLHFVVDQIEPPESDKSEVKLPALELGCIIQINNTGQETVIEEKSECTIQNEEVDKITNVARTGTEATLDQQLYIDPSKSADTNKLHLVVDQIEPPESDKSEVKLPALELGCIIQINNTGQETVIEEKSECTIQNEEVDKNTNVARTGTATLDQQLYIDPSKSADTNKLHLVVDQIEPPESDKSEVKLPALELGCIIQINNTAQRKSCLKNVGKLLCEDNIQYIKRKQIDRWSKVLPYSGKFRSKGVEYKLHSDGCLLTSNNDYVAVVSLAILDKLDLADNFNAAKCILLRNLKIVNVLLDEQSQKSIDAQEYLQTCLNEMCEKTSTNIQHAEDLFQLVQITSRGSKNILAAINVNWFISQQLKTAIQEYAKMKASLAKRVSFFSTLKSFFKRSDIVDLPDILASAVEKGIALHRERLNEKCLPSMKTDLNSLKNKQILFVTSRDLCLISDLANLLNSTDFAPAVATISDRFIKKVTQMNTNSLKGVVPITNQIYLFLCKSLLEVADEVKSLAKVEQILKYSNNKWTLADLSNWIPGTTLDMCLLHQLQTLHVIINHFEPGKNTAVKRYPYKFKVFTESIIGDDIASLPDELQVWMCLMDDIIIRLFPITPENMQTFGSLLHSYTKFMLSGDFGMATLESYRMITHNTARFVAQTYHLARDKSVLLKQIDFMSMSNLENRMTYTEFRDIIEVFTVYWKTRQDFMASISTKLPGTYFEPVIEEIEELLLQCVTSALEKKVNANDLINLFRAYDELMIDMIDFSFDWFVRLQHDKNCEILTMSQIITLVDNKWKDNDLKCYYVTDKNKFVLLHKILCENNEVPKHYVVDIVKTLLNCINTVAKEKIWSNEDHSLTDKEQLSAVVLLISAVRNSLLYLKEQPDYVCFERFGQDSIKPFLTVITESPSFSEFNKRVLLVKEAFWYIRNINAMDIDAAIECCRSMNDSFGCDLLKATFIKYTQQYEQYMANCPEEHDHADRIDYIVEDIERDTESKLTAEWTVEFKQNILPKILAALAAIWSIENSKDVASTGQYLKPHCIQILCVMRLLGVDDEKAGVSKHLAQVLTGQGKSLILAFTATVLALFGHKVQLMCYSDYLVNRDKEDFEFLFEYFTVSSSISYRTFRRVASLKVNDMRVTAGNYIKNCLGLPLEEITVDTPNTNNNASSVLLIDEVDVFFTNAYGETYNPVVLLDVPGIALIQIKMWNMVVQGYNDSVVLHRQIMEYVNNSSHCELKKLVAFTKRSKKYTLLKYNSNYECEKQPYDNEQLFSEHLNLMITTAIDVKNSLDNDFRLNHEGAITMKDENSKYVCNWIDKYYNTFYYFKLKRENFQQSIGTMKNYGYLILDSGCISYAKMIEDYPLILGVTGTLTTLNEYEQKAVQEHYEIRKSSVMPSFFGCHNLKFNSTLDFMCLPNESEWIQEISIRSQKMIDARRSVIVFFENDCLINTFVRARGHMFNRLNILTVETHEEDRTRYVNDAGVSKTCTLATREMGRGVDYKSSVSVEKNGGIHVIQTFYSLDAKEETQIKGRTARKDNRGSYELVVCLSDLKKAALVEDYVECARISYFKAEESRNSIANSTGTRKLENVQQAEDRQNKMIDFYKNIKDGF